MLWTPKRGLLLHGDHDFHPPGPLERDPPRPGVCDFIVPGCANAMLLAAAQALPAFPVVVSTNTSFTDNSVSQVVSLPASLVSGNLLFIMLSITDGATITTPTNWTELFKTVSAGTFSYACYYKTSDGGEGASVTVTIGSGTSDGAHCSYQISGHQGTPEAAVNNASVDCPNLAPSWGSAKTMWLSGCYVGTSADSDVTAAPTNHTNLLAAKVTGGRGVIGSARRESEAASEDPGTFTVASQEYPRSATIAIRPA